MKSLGRFSIGVGDRFAHQAAAQLRACIQAAEAGTVVVPVWNKSNREHMIIGSEPAETRAAADAAVRRLQWHRPYFCDADHINLRTVDRFLEPCDFFTIDVADQIGVAAAQAELDAFVHRRAGLIGRRELPGISEPLSITRADLERVGRHYLAAVLEAAKTYRYIEQAKERDAFLTEVSMDETDCTADTRRPAADSCCAGGCWCAGGDDCAEVYGTVQQGRRLCGRSWRFSRGSWSRIWR